MSIGLLKTTGNRLFTDQGVAIRRSRSWEIATVTFDLIKFIAELVIYWVSHQTGAFSGVW